MIPLTHIWCVQGIKRGKCGKERKPMQRIKRYSMRKKQYRVRPPDGQKFDRSQKVCMQWNGMRWLCLLLLRTVPIISSNNGGCKAVTIAGHVCLIFATAAPSFPVCCCYWFHCCFYCCSTGAAIASIGRQLLVSAFVFAVSFSSTWPANRLQIERKHGTSYAPPVSHHHHLLPLATA